MNNIAVKAQNISMPSWAETTEDFAQKVLQQISRDNWDLSIVFCDDALIKSMNSQYRGKDEATDILSFGMGEHIPGGRFLAGDIIISLDTLRENAAYFNESEDRELRRLIIHGILHLDGMEHSAKDAPMLVLQEDILSRLKDIHILADGD
jgi:probable rRNA maturation factor